jgi:hypothetical protein
LLLALPHEPIIYSAPDWIGRNARQHADQQAQKCKAGLRNAKPMILLEDQGKRAEKQIQNAQQDGAQDAQIEALQQQSVSIRFPITAAAYHWLEDQELKRADA